MGSKCGSIGYWMGQARNCSLFLPLRTAFTRYTGRRTRVFTSPVALSLLITLGSTSVSCSLSPAPSCFSRAFSLSMFTCSCFGSSRKCLLPHLISQLKELSLNIRTVPLSLLARNRASSDRTRVMRYQNWDVLLFPRDSRIPIQEFDTKCFALDQSKFCNCSKDAF